MTSSSPLIRRLIAVGDIHGQYGLLEDLLAQLEPHADDQLVFLGDYVDRGPATPAVLDRLIAIKLQLPRTVFLRGNHEQMLLDAVFDSQRKRQGNNWLIDFIALQGRGLPPSVEFFLACGGRQTVWAYSNDPDTADPIQVLSSIPTRHLDFLWETCFYFEHLPYFFVHAGVDPQDPHGVKTDNRAFLWEREPIWRQDANWKKVVVHGHTPVPEPNFAEQEINLDTGAGHGGCLTACDLLSGKLWQAGEGRI